MSESRPNLVYVLADQLRYQSCGCAGDTKAQTPNMDALSRQGAECRNAVSGHPLCAPYRASLFTGKYTSSTGMVINELRIDPGHECLAHVLTRHGYQTAYIGKWHLWANEYGNHGDPKNAFVPPGPHRLGFEGFWAGYNFHHNYYSGYYYGDTPTRIRVHGYEPDVQTDLAIELLREFVEERQPFALFLSPGTPHDPWEVGNVPRDSYDLFSDTEFEMPATFDPAGDPHTDAWGIFSDRNPTSAVPEWLRVYYAMVANLDWNLGRLVKAIDDLGLRENTVLVFTSDHGEMFGAHGLRGKNIFYDEAVRVPFLVSRPGVIPAGHVTDVCLNTPDIMPTLLSMMGLPIPSEVEGTDLSHCALGSNGAEPEAAFMMGMGSVAVWEDGHEWRALRTKRHTYAVYRSDGQEMLFDNLADPLQQHNLARDPAHRALLDELRSMLRRRMAELGDKFERSTWYRDNWTRDRIILPAEKQISRQVRNDGDS